MQPLISEDKIVFISPMCIKNKNFTLWPGLVVFAPDLSSVHGSIMAFNIKFKRAGVEELRLTSAA